MSARSSTTIGDVVSSRRSRDDGTVLPVVSSPRPPSTAWRGAWLAVVSVLWLLLGCGKAPVAEEEAPIRVAAASDLTRAFEEVAKAYEAKTGKKTKLTFGSTGLLSKQVLDGAPFDVFAAANVSFVDEVVQNGSCDGSTKALYARGRIVVYTKEGEAPKDLAELASDRFKKVAIANPEHAPYGRAAKEALEAEGIYESVKAKLTYGENISQTLQFADSGNVDVALVALSLAIGSPGRYTLIDDSLHKPLDQALVVCGSGAAAERGRGFADFVSSPEGREIMRRYGFLLPGETLSVAEK
jgi:molybdate transport system substrate-binding protein